MSSQTSPKKFPKFSKFTAHELSKKSFARMKTLLETPTPNQELADALDPICKSFLLAFSDLSYSDAQFLEMIEKIVFLKTGHKLDQRRLLMLVSVYRKMHVLVNIESVRTKSDGTKQSSETLKLALLLKRCTEKNFHSVQAPCKIKKTPVKLPAKMKTSKGNYSKQNFEKGNEPVSTIQLAEKELKENLETFPETSSESSIPIQSSNSDGVLPKEIVSEIPLDPSHEASREAPREALCCGNGLPFVPGTTDHIFDCVFHKYDSLSTHLVLASILNALLAETFVVQNPSLSSTILDPEQKVPDLDGDQVVFIAAFLGLFHDVGKVDVVETNEQRNFQTTGFPAHGEIGAKKVQYLWTNSMSKCISYNDYRNVCRAIHMHMCGYHDTHCQKNLYKRHMLLIENRSVLSLLSINSFGDSGGKIAAQISEDSDITTSTDALNEMQKFRDFVLNENNKFDLKFITSTFKTKSNQMIRTNKLIFFLIGTSGSGKTWILNQMLEKYQNQISYVSRDCCISKVAVNVDKRLEGVTYQTMYAVYEAFVNLFKNTADKKALGKLNAAQEQWNQHVGKIKEEDPSSDLSEVEMTVDKKVTSVSEEVNKLYVKKIEEALKGNSKLIVIDSMMNCWAQQVEAVMPKIIEEHFRIHCHVINSREIVSSTISTNIEAQLKVTGPFGFDSLFPKGGFEKSKKSYASISSDIGTDGDLPNKCLKTPFRPHIAFSCIRTIDGDHGYSEMFEALDKILDSVQNVSQESCPEQESKQESKQESCPEQEASQQSLQEIKEEEKSSLRSDYPLNRNEIIDVIDPTVSSMNAVEYYSHLLKQFGSVDKISEYLLGRGFHLTHFLRMPKEVPMQEFYQRLSNLSADWHKNGIINQTYTVEDFAKSTDLLTSFVDSFVLLKYKDGFIGKRFWQNVWAKEMRGVVIFTNPETKVSEGLYKMPRGAEVITGMVIDNNIETQDVTEENSEEKDDFPKMQEEYLVAEDLSKRDQVLSKFVKVLDAEQVHTCQLLCSKTSQPVSMTLSSKADGFLLLITSYTGKSLKLMQPVVEQFGTTFVKLFAEQSLKITGNRMLVISTHGTLMESGFMEAYIATAMYSSLKVSREDMLKKSSLKALEEFGEKWICQFLQTFEFHDDITDRETFCFEGICKDRRGLFGDNDGFPHQELASSYSFDKLVFLGKTVGRFYVPHFHCKLKTSLFDVPLWWKIEQSGVINEMLEAIDCHLMNSMTKNEFLQKFPPSNPDFDVSNEEHLNNAIIDYEGWVILKDAEKSVDKELQQISQKLSIPETIYSKIKTKAYYFSHSNKLDVKRTDYLVKLAENFGQFFPAAMAISVTSNPKILEKRFLEFGEAILKAIDFSDENDPTIVTIRNTFEKSVIEATERIAAGDKKVKVPKDPLNGFASRPNDVKWRIILNCKGFDFDSLILSHFLKAFPEIMQSESLSKFVMGILMKFQPWHSSFLERVANLSHNDDTISELISLCLQKKIKYKKNA